MKIKILIMAVMFFYSFTCQGQTGNIYITPQKGFKLKSSGWLMIDVRSRDAFEKSRIPDSLNIPVQILAEKHFLKGKNIIIAGSGLNDRELEKVLKDLEESKINALILKGGINNWYSSHRPVTGLLFDKDSLNKISISDFYKTNKKRAAIIVTDSGLEKSLKTGYIIKLSINDYKQKIELPDSVKKEKNRFDIVFLFTDGFERKISEELISSGFNNIFYIQGKIKDYQNWAEKMNIAAAGNKTMKKQGFECIPCLKNRNLYK